MISNDERRRTASWLREAVLDATSECEVLNDKLMVILEIENGCHEGHSGICGIARLAEMIDRPLCLNLAKYHDVGPVETEGFFECSNCHCVAQQNKIGLTLNYCPHCGMEVFE